MEQFTGIDTNRKACLLFPESFASQFFVVTEVCKRAEVFRQKKHLCGEKHVRRIEWPYSLEPDDARIREMLLPSEKVEAGEEKGNSEKGL